MTRSVIGYTVQLGGILAILLGVYLILRAAPGPLALVAVGGAALFVGNLIRKRPAAVPRRF